MSSLIIRKPFTQKRVKIQFPKGEGRTRQDMKKECDVNFIVSQYLKTGRYPIGAVGTFGNFDGYDYMEALNALAAAQDAFDSLPAKIRKKFNNDPLEFVEFCGDDGNHSELVKLGLAKELPVESGARMEPSNTEGDKQPG